jgi:hypothetical protein
MPEQLGSDPSQTIGDTQHGQRRLPPIDSLPEYALLKGEDVAATPEAAAGPEAGASAEAKRTKLSIDCVVGAYHGDMSRFAGLSEIEQSDLHQSTREIIGDDETLEAFSYLLLTHDIGKSERARQAAGAGPHVDHDEVFSMLLDPERETVRQALMPSFDLLPPEGQELVRKVARLRTNYPQVLQGEAPASTLEDLHNEPDPKVCGLAILEAKFDIFGAAGHVNQERSLSATTPTYRRMRNLDNALLDPALATVEERHHAFLDAEVRDLTDGRIDPSAMGDIAEQQQWRTLARSECHLRHESSEEFGQFVEVFKGQSLAVQAIYTSEFSKDGVTDRAILPYYGPGMLRELNKKYGTDFALKYYAHIIQEAHLADKEARASGQTGVVMAELGSVLKGVIADEFDPRETLIRFSMHDGVLVPELHRPEALVIDDLPAFGEGEALRGKRAIVVGMGGGSDGVQAAEMRKLLKAKYDIEDAVVVSVRNERRQVTNTGSSIGTATKEITPSTQPVGNWRYLEGIPMEGDDPARTFILNSTDPNIVQEDLAALVEATGAEVVIGLDTGGDALYRTEHAGFSATNAADITPDQDRQVLTGLEALAGRHSNLRVLTTVVAPGVDSPPYARDVLVRAGATQIPLDTDDVTKILSDYAQWRMDGSGNDEGRYGKTPLAWLHALGGNFGTQVLDLPISNIISKDNPWRAFAGITPSMAKIVLMDINRHMAAVQPEEETGV